MTEGLSGTHNVTLQVRSDKLSPCRAPRVLEATDTMAALLSERPRACLALAAGFASKRTMSPWACLALAAAASCATAAGRATGNKTALLDAAVLRIVTEASSEFNTSYSLAVHGASLHVAHAAGPNDRAAAHDPVTPASRIPAGSVTKAWTATLLMRLVEQQSIGLDELAHVRIDKFLASQVRRLVRAALALMRNRASTF